MIDVLLPTCRPKQSHLREALDALLAQTEQHWQLWVRDEPTDVNTHTMLTPYLSDERIHFACNEHQLGIGGNWNACLRHGNAPFVQFLFQDDVWQPVYLASALRVLKKHPDVGFVSLGHRYTFEGEVGTAHLFGHVQKIRAGISSGTHEGNTLLLDWIDQGLHPNIIGEPSFVMLRREAVEKTGAFHKDMVQNLDAEYWMRMLAHTNWHFVPGEFGTFRVHADAASTRQFAAGEGIFDRLRMLHRAAALVQPHERTRARMALRRHRRSMVEKFLMRYGGHAEPLCACEPVLMYLLRQPWTTLKSGYRFLLQRCHSKRQVTP